MTALIRGFYAAVLGWVVGSVGSGFAAPGIITWYNVPGKGQAMCDCRDLAQSVVLDFYKTQQVISAFTSLMFLVLYIILRNAFSSKKPVAPPNSVP